jgi:hypothetical protein
VASALALIVGGLIGLLVFPYSTFLYSFIHSAVFVAMRASLRDRRGSLFSRNFSRRTFTHFSAHPRERDAKNRCGNIAARAQLSGARSCAHRGAQD